MRWTRCYIPTLKEDPADAEVVSHKLLVRAGMIRRLTAGIYTYLPLGLRVLNKVVRVVREEMDRASAVEILMPMVQPADLWLESGRWEAYGKELLRFHDRSDREYCLGSTHEEIITDLLRGEVKSYRQLPLNFYQVQGKFRDEMRPRFGLLRGREFVMKDAYSFDRDEDGAAISYQAMYDAYSRIFRRLGMRFRAVEADSGPIGGSHSHEFMVLADTGEDIIAVCMACEYAANLEKAEVVCTLEFCDHTCPLAELIATPGQHTAKEVATFLKVGLERIIKTLLYDVDGQSVAVLVRGDRELNEVKLKNLLRATDFSLASQQQVEAWTGAPIGFVGPVGLAKVSYIFADEELCYATDWIVGANVVDAHFLHVSLARDVSLTGFADLRMIAANDPCPRCAGTMEFTRGIEVGHIFRLGTKYSKAMNAKFLDEQGTEQFMVMGCYGIGISRIMAACIEQNHDAAGILFPPAMAPYDVLILLLNPLDAAVAAKAEELYVTVRDQGFDVLLDDRDERPGIKFKDADLIGSPIQLVIGSKGLAAGIVEVKDRRSGQRFELSLVDFPTAFVAWRTDILSAWPE
ncbi:proline--tRNA ligase [Desulfovibrionales bacterium]